MLTALNALREDLGVRWLVVARLLALAGAPVTLWLALTRLDDAARGVYLVAVSVATIGPLFETGPGTLVVQFAARGPAEAARIRRVAGRWYTIAAGGVAILAGAGGVWWVGGRTALDDASFTAWWSLLAFSASGYVLLVPSLCLEEGAAGRVAVQRLRARQAVLTLVLLSGGLSVDVGLPAAALAALGVLLLSWHFVRKTHRPTAESRATADGELDASHGFAPRQNRSAVTWLALWAAAQALTPLVYRAADPATAGIVGVHVGLALAPMMIAVAWLHARFPAFGALASAGLIDDFDAAVGRALRQSASAFVLLAACLMCFVLLVQRVLPDVGEKLSPALVLLLLVSSLVLLLIQAMLAWLRAFAEEPLAGSVAAAAGLALAGGGIGAAHHGVVGSGIGHAIGSLVGLSVVIIHFIGARAAIRATHVSPSHSWS